MEVIMIRHFQNILIIIREKMSTKEAKIGCAFAIYIIIFLLIAETCEMLKESFAVGTIDIEGILLIGILFGFLIGFLACLLIFPRK